MADTACPNTEPHRSHGWSFTGRAQHHKFCPGVPDPDPRDAVGRVVRQIWVAAVIELIPDPKPSWVTTWADLTDPFQREVDMRIGAELYAAGREAERLDWMRSMQTKLDHALSEAREEGAADARQRISEGLAGKGYRVGDAVPFHVVADLLVGPQ